MKVIPIAVTTLAFILDFVANFFDKGRVFALARVAVTSALVFILLADEVVVVFFFPGDGGCLVDPTSEEQREQHIHTNGDSKQSQLFLCVFPIFEELKVLVV